MNINKRYITNTGTIQDLFFGGVQGTQDGVYPQTIDITKDIQNKSKYYKIYFKTNLLSPLNPVINPGPGFDISVPHGLHKFQLLLLSPSLPSQWSNLYQYHSITIVCNVLLSFDLIQTFF